MKSILASSYLYIITIVIAMTVGFIKTTDIGFVLKAKLQGAEQYAGAVVGLYLLRQWLPITSSAFFIITITIYLNDQLNSFQKVIRSSLVLMLGVISSATFILGSILSATSLFDLSLQVYLENIFMYITWFDLRSFVTNTMFIGFILFYITYNERIRAYFSRSTCLKVFFIVLNANPIIK